MANEIENKVWEALKGVTFPGMSRDIVSFGFVDRVEVREGVARVDLTMSTHSREAADEVKHQVENALAALDEIDAAEVSLSVSQPPSAQEAVSQQPNLIPGIRHVIAVARLHVLIHAAQ